MVAPPGTGRGIGTERVGEARDWSGGNRSGNRGGMSPSLLQNKYPGATKKKSRQYDLTPGNVAKVGTIVGSVIGGPIGTAIAAGYSTAEAIAEGRSPLAGALDPFSGRGPDVPSTGAGFAQGADKDISAEAAAKKDAMKKAVPKKTKPKLAPGFSLLSGVGGTLLGT